MGNENRHIPNKLKKHRLIMGYSQKEVAGILGHYNAARVSKWEKGLATPSIKSVFKLSILYRTLPDQLFYGIRESAKEELRLVSPSRNT